MRENFDDATRGIETALGIDAAPGIAGNFCTADLCQAWAGNIQYRSLGGTLELFPSNRDPAEVYMAACAGALAGLARIDANLADGAVIQSFARASVERLAKMEVSGVEMKVAPKVDDRLSCEFWRR
ncbi:hypothetical protein CLD20_08105 [Afifella sp. IM 167]|nr:hypothetical protein [Afifella sp. IM 167]